VLTVTADQLDEQRSDDSLPTVELAGCLPAPLGYIVVALLAAYGAVLLWWRCRQRRRTGGGA
jgi:hypothetical protein